jgi:hypothetical protein
MATQLKNSPLDNHFARYQTKSITHIHTVGASSCCMLFFSQSLLAKDNFNTDGEDADAKVDADAERMRVA